MEPTILTYPTLSEEAKKWIKENGGKIKAKQFISCRGIKHQTHSYLLNFTDPEDAVLFKLRY